jgi:TolB-like protein
MKVLPADRARPASVRGPRDHRRAAGGRCGPAGEESGLGKPPPPPNPAIAVLAFENLSGDPKQEYFSDGLAVEVLDRLGRVPGLRVIASSSSFSYKGKNQDAKTIASQLGVTTVLEGSVRRAGTKLKFSAKLIDGMTGYQIWSGL